MTVKIDGSGRKVIDVPVSEASPIYPQLGCRLAAGIFLDIALAVAAHFGTQIGRKGIYATDADTVETARHLVGVFIELTAGMKHGQDYFECAFMLFLMKVNRNTSAIIDNRDGVVFVDGHLDMGAESRESLIDRVVDNLVDKVVETFLD